MFTRNSRRPTILLIAAVVLFAAATTFFGVAPRRLDNAFNPVVGTTYVASERARILHGSLFVVDLHADQMLWDRNVLRRVRRGHVDLERLNDGNVALQVFSAVTKSPWGQNNDRNEAGSDRITPLMIAQARPPRTWFDINERAVHQAERLRDAIDASGGRMTLIRSLPDLDRLVERRRRGERVVGALLAMEGLHDLRDDPRRFHDLVDAGYRMMAFAHFFDNALAGSAHGIDKGGLTAFGREVVELMRRSGIVMDLAHVSVPGMDEILDTFDRPVVVSHTGVQGTCPGPRNLDDRMLHRIHDNGGVVGIGYWEAAVCGTEPADIAAAARYVADRIGVDHVALGSDFDGSVSTAFDVSGLSLVTSALLEADFTADEVAAIAGGNAVRVLRANLPAE